MNTSALWKLLTPCCLLALGVLSYYVLIAGEVVIGTTPLQLLFGQVITFGLPWILFALAAVFAVRVTSDRTLSRVKRGVSVIGTVLSLGLLIILSTAYILALL